ncbi:MAG TPA: hypothetical protein VEC35_24855 [Noviherbaspirillum sp.]|nr:hypothetical protein [Noviherbaspirillum sp.]
MTVMQAIGIVVRMAALPAMGHHLQRKEVEDGRINDGPPDRDIAGGG